MRAFLCVCVVGVVVDVYVDVCAGACSCVMEGISEFYPPNLEDRLISS